MRQLTLMACLVVSIATVGFAGAHTTKAYSLTIKLTGNQEPMFTVCTLVRIEEPFEVALTDGKSQTFLWGKLQHAKNKGMIRLELEISKGRGDHSDFDRLGYELKLGATERPVVVYTRNHPGVEEPEITLADGGCPTLKDDDPK